MSLSSPSIPLSFCLSFTYIFDCIFQQKSKMQKMHAQMQEQQSLRQLELAKSTNIDKLVST